MEPTLHEHRIESPHSEREHLQQRVQEEKLRSPEKSHHEITRSLTEEYLTSPYSLHAHQPVQDVRVDSLVLALSPEPHDEQMKALIRLAQEKGIKAALLAVEKLADPHLEDDFHRFLAEYLREGNDLKGRDKKSE